MRNALLEFGPLSQGRGPLYPRRAAPAVRIARPRQQQEQEEDQQQPLQQPVQQPVQAVAPPVAEPPAPAEQDDTGLVGKIADGALTAVGALGNVLDLPGSSVRDILQGKNPFDQWLDPLSHAEKGTSSTGRDLLETYGMRKNKETGWVPLEDPGEFARDAAGFAAELALDPLGWMTGWMSSAAGKGARGTKALAAAADTAKAVKQPGVVRRAAGKMGDAFDAVDPGHQLGRAVHGNETTRQWVQDAGKGVRGTVGASIRRASKYARGANRWADQVDPFPSGGERQRFSTEARRTFGEEADEFMPVMDARARTWAKEAAERSPDEYFKDLSTKQSDIDNLPDEALRQGEAAAVETPAFKEWFGDVKADPASASKVVDTDGKPLRVFHGTPTGGFDEFSNDLKGRSDNGLRGRGFYFADSHGLAHGYSTRGVIESVEGSGVSMKVTRKPDSELNPQVYEAYLNIKNPYDANVDSEKLRIKGVWGQEFTDHLTSLGYDGVKYVMPSGDNTEWVAFDPTQIKSVNNRGTFDPSNPNILFHPAYHGSPHRFDEFSLHKIGSGEGAQAYGWGLYFTDTKAIAERYKRSLTRNRRISDADLREYFTPGRKVSGYSGEDIVEKFDWNDGDWSVTVRGVERGPGGTGTRLRRHATYPTDDNFEKTMGRKPDKGGALYEVDLAPKQDEYLLWDEPLSKQSKKVREALADEIELEIQSSLGDLGPGDKLEDISGANLYLRMQSADMTPGIISRLIDSTLSGIESTPPFVTGIEGRIDKGAIVDNLYDAIGNQRLTPDDIEETLKDLFDEYIPEAIRTDDPDLRSVIINSLTDTFRGAVKNQISPEEVSRTLKKKGVRGIKYLDGISRGKSKGSYNYVVFDDSDVTIQNMFRQEGAAGAPRGAVVFKDSKRVIHAFKSADISTLAHESAHVFRRDLSEELQAAAESAIDKMIDGNVRGADGNWTREAEEAFASGFERYLRDGSAPSEQLKSTFEKFKEWLTEIYQNIVGTPLENNVSPELRGVFNSMLQSGESAGRIQRAGAKAVHLASDAIRRTPDAARDARTKLSQAFDRRVRDRVTSQVQQGARVATDAEDAFLNEYRGAFVPLLDEMDAMAHDLTKGIDADKWARDTSNQIRYALETRNSIIDDARLQKIDPRLHEPLRQFKEYQSVLLKQAQEAGLNVTELQDEMIDYLHRQASERNIEWMKANGVDSVRGGSGAETGAGVGRRSQLLKGGYSEAFDEVLADPKAHGMLDDAHPLRETDPEAYDEAIEKIAERLEQVAGERILKNMKKVDDDGKFVMTDLETGFETSIGAKELGELKPDTQILAGDKVQWTADGARKFPEPQVVESIVQYDGHSFVTFKGQTAKAPLGQVNHWDDIAGDTRPTSSTRMGRTVTEKMRGADGKVLKDADGLARTEEQFKTFEHVIEDRFNALARHMHDRPIYLETGGLYTSPLHAMHTGARAVISGMTNARLTTETLVEGFRSGILEMPFTGRGDTMTLDKLFDNSALSAMDRRKAYQKIVDGNQDRFGDDWVEQMKKGGRGGMFEAEGGEGLQILKGKQPAGPVGANLDDSEFFKHVGRIKIDKEFADDITRAWEFQKADSTGLGKSVNDNFRSFTAMFKAGVLNSPQRFTRDGVSGQIKNMTHGIFSGTAFKSMFNVLFNRPDKFLQELPQVQDYMKARKWDDTPENATKSVRQMYAARRGHSSSIYHDLDQTDDALDASQDFEQLRGTLLGRHSGLWDLLKDITATAVGRRGGTFDPRDVAGVHWGNDGVRRAESKLAPVQAGELTGRYMDDSNRLVGFIESMRKGVSADEAMKIVDDVQLNYDPRTFTPTEQMLKKFFPFYSFFTREVKYLSNELITNPAGRLGKLIRLQAAGARRVEDEDGNYIPEHARTQMSIPVGRSEDGGTTYFSGLGLMHDDPVEKLMTLAIDPMAGVRKGLSQLNPLVKGPLESAMGVSTFQGGPLGGRDLSDMDPTIGRILTNLGLQDPTPSGRAAPVMGQRWIENMAANSPAARILSNIKTAGDDRKSAAQRLMNLSTGMRFTTVSPHQSRAALRDLSDSILKEAGARKFSTYTPPTDEALAEIEKTNPEAATKLRAIRRNRELVNQERRAGIRRNEMQAVQQSIDSGQMPAMTKTQQQRYDRWVKNFGTATSPDQWTQYVYQRKADGTAQRSGIKDWAPKK